MGVKNAADASTPPSRQLDFDPQSFVNVGSWLSAQERRPTTCSSTQTPDGPEGVTGEHSNKSSRRVMMGLVALVLALVALNIYSFNQTRAWKVERSELQAKIAKLERPLPAPRQGPSYPAAPSNVCPSNVLDNCWIKVGLGDCAQGAFEDPVGKVEDALVYAWESTAGLVGAVGEGIAHDFYELGKELHAFASAVVHFLGDSSG